MGGGTNHITGGNGLRDKTYLCKHIGGARALFSYVNLQVNDSVGSQNHVKFLLGNALPPCPLQVCVWGRTGIQGHPHMQQVQFCLCISVYSGHFVGPLKIHIFISCFQRQDCANLTFICPMHTAEACSFIYWYILCYIIVCLLYHEL